MQNEQDLERYFTSPPDEDGLGGTLAEFRTVEKRGAKGQAFSWQERIGHEVILCNPYQCPYGRGTDPKTGKPYKTNRDCKPTVDIRFRLGSWANGEMALCHAKSWSTAGAIKDSLAVLFQEAGGQFAGVEVDLVLAYTGERRTPYGNKERQPFWTLQRPWGVSPEEFRRRAKAVQEDFAELRLLQAQNAGLLGTGLSQRALLPEFRPELDLGEAGEVASDDPLSATEKATLAELMDTGMSQAAALATLSRKPEEIDEVLAAAEVEVAAPDEPESDVIEGEVEEDEVVEDEGPVEPLFPEPPTDPLVIRDTVLAKGMKEATFASNIVRPAWEAATGEAQGALPTPSQCPDPDVAAEVIAGMVTRAEDLWRAHQNKAVEEATE